MVSAFPTDHRGRRRSWLSGVPALLVLLVPVGCGYDEAQREASAAAEIADHGGPLEEQLAHLDRAIEIAPERAYYWESRAGLYMSLCDNAQALADIDRAVELADRPYLRFKRGLILCRSGRFAEALPEFDMAIGQQPENSQFYRGRALARLALGEAEAAHEDTTVLSRLSPHNIYNYYVRGAVLVALARYDEALIDLDRSVAMLSDAIYPLRARAECLHHLGHPLLAAVDREQADKLESLYGRDHWCGYQNTPYN